MSALSQMDRSSRAQWQAAAAGKRRWYALPAGGLRIKRSWAVVTDVKFAHRCLLNLARGGDKFDPFWWA